jgi:thioredoxin reductase (NADPH)
MYDLIVIGAGPAGLTAGIYGTRAGLKTLIIEGEGTYGGQILTTYDVDNYPGLPGIGGFELGTKFKEHAENAGAEFKDAMVVKILDKGDHKTVVTSAEEIDARTVIVATGAAHNHLGVPGEEEMAGAGVSYCATCDGAFFRNRTTVVVGGGDVALEDALFLARACKKVYLVHRRDAFRGAKKLQDAVLASEIIEPVYDSVVTEIKGDGMVTGVTLKNVKTGEESPLETDGVFIAVGTHPITEFAAGLLDMDEKGYIKADETGVTNVAGIFVAGDARTKKLRQVVTAASDGANAVNSATDYLNG